MTLPLCWRVEKSVKPKANMIVKAAVVLLMMKASYNHFSLYIPVHSFNAILLRVSWFELIGLFEKY